MAHRRRAVVGGRRLRHLEPGPPQQPSEEDHRAGAPKCVERAGEVGCNELLDRYADECFGLNYSTKGSGRPNAGPTVDVIWKEGFLECVLLGPEAWREKDAEARRALEQEERRKREQLLGP
ncbi:MAG: hypothetical protein ACOX6T_08890 [Myxococcales bacterium]